MSNNKVTKEMLMEMMEVFLKEREYVSGSKMPTQKSKYIEVPAHFRAIYSRKDVIKGLQSLEKYCNVVMGLETKQPNFSKNSISDTFNRMIAVEYLHKFLLQISTGQETLSDNKKLGFGMENLLVNLLGGEIKAGEIEDVVIDGVNKGIELSIKLLSTKSLTYYGVKQSLSFVEGWLEKNKSIGNKTINYLIFEKVQDDSSVGINCYQLNLNKKQVEDAAQVAYNKNKKKEAAANKKAKERQEFRAWKKLQASEASQDSKIVKESMKEDAEVVFVYKDALGKPFASIILPKNIDKFLENNFSSIDNGISLLYKSLDGFKDSVTAWVQAEQGVTEKEKAEEALAELNSAAEII